MHTQRSSPSMSQPLCTHGIGRGRSAQLGGNEPPLLPSTPFCLAFCDRWWILPLTWTQFLETPLSRSCPSGVRTYGTGTGRVAGWCAQRLHCSPGPFVNRGSLLWLACSYQDAGAVQLYGHAIANVISESYFTRFGGLIAWGQWRGMCSRVHFLTLHRLLQVACGLCLRHHQLCFACVIVPIPCGAIP